ncbi:hypothetical protein BOX37_26220 [Nocardia mangyaensis]|uniref:DUF8176 domain-containing protein n=1 Tax=Nocardia mangyaensis TaxID=2213200 RepID=A0A1J0VXW3_9NOCA|nr:hypothetical protein [Nocardia mangyaensis]APE36845.1 hypothetical protein BOX37_26220 [Nocardia mangyaensis]
MYAQFDTTNVSSTARSHRHRWVAAAVLGTLAALAVIAVVTAPDGSTQPTGSGCEPPTDPDLFTGSGPGDTTNGPAAIFGFNHAYYVDRSAEQARRFLTPDSVIAAGDRLQTGIDAVPSETRHCVSISLLGSFGDAARWKVTVGEFRPGIEPWIAEQTITTRTLEGATLISEITATPA